MKQKLKNLKKNVSDNREDVMFYSAFTAMTVGAIWAAVKIQQIEAQKIQAARDAGHTVIETPWGNVIY